MLAAGSSVRAVGRRSRPPRLREIEYLQVDLRDAAGREKALRGIRIVFHLAAIGWGLHENLKQQAELLTENILLNTGMLDAAYRSGVERYLYTSSSSIYPACLEELDEDAPWDRPPHESELNFGWAKRVGEIQARAYYQNHGMAIAIVRPANPYGPWDSFDPSTSHVIPALIRRAVAKETPFTVWGTGSSVRSFIFAQDVAKGMLLALERCANCKAINLASHECARISDLVRLVLELCGHVGAELRFDTAKPDGHPRKVPSTQRAREMGLVNLTPLREGVQQTVDWYLRNRLAT